MNAPRILALDLSLRATGFATNAGGVALTGTIFPGTVAGSLTGMDRITFIRRQIMDRMTGIEYVVVEAAILTDTGAYGKETAMLHGAVLDRLNGRGTPFALVHPGTLKSYATSKGRASKDEMRGEVVARFPRFNGDHNAADALALCAMACEHFGDILGEFGFPNPAAIGRVQWPDRPGVLTS